MLIILNVIIKEKKKNIYSFFNENIYNAFFIFIVIFLVFLVYLLYRIKQYQAEIIVRNTQTFSSLY